VVLTGARKIVLLNANRVIQPTSIRYSAQLEVKSVILFCIPGKAVAPVSFDACIRCDSFASFLLVSRKPPPCGIYGECHLAGFLCIELGMHIVETLRCTTPSAICSTRRTQTIDRMVYAGTDCTSRTTYSIRIVWKETSMWRDSIQSSRDGR
jgi:hypothetical protein